VSVTAWPGTEPDRTDPTPLHEALQQGQPVGLIARNHGMSTEHLRHVVRRHSLPGRAWLPPRSGTLVPLDTATERVAAARYVDLGWLREQYLNQHRSLSDLAAEIGCGISRLAQFAKQHGIPLRPPGGGADYLAGDIPLATRTELPGLLRDALRGHHGRQRVERFLLLAHTNNQRRVADQIGITSSVLTEQLALLERRCGGLLFDRHPRRSAISLHSASSSDSKPSFTSPTPFKKRRRHDQPSPPRGKRQISRHERRHLMDRATGTPACHTTTSPSPYTPPG
jgi:hypothetical protein